MKKLFLALAIVAFTAINFINFSKFQTHANKSELNLTSLNLVLAGGENCSYKGPLCSNPSGTRYCCKGSSGSCAGSVKCSSCS